MSDKPQKFYEFAHSQALFGCEIEIKLVFGQPNHLADSLLEKCFFEARRIHHKYSRFLEDNPLFSLNSRLNQWVEVDEEFFELLEFGQKMCLDTGGAFDLTVKNLLESWGYDANYSLKSQKIAGFDSGPKPVFKNSEKDKNPRISKKIAFQKLPQKRVKISSPVDFGGLGKGYLLDKLSKIILSADDFLVGFAINAGGDLYAWGKNGKNPWRMAFEHPTDTKKAIGFVDVDDFFLAGSSPLRRHWELENGLSRHHLVDNEHQLPAGKMAAVYVQSSAGIVADAYATALFVLGFEKAKDFLENLEKENLQSLEKLESLENLHTTSDQKKFTNKLEAMLVSREGKIWRSKEFCGEIFTKND